MTTRIISFNEDGSMRNDLQTAFFNTGLQIETILNAMEKAGVELDPEDYDTPAEREHEPCNEVGCEICHN